MSLITNMREKRLEELDNFLSNSKKKLSAIVSTLGWSIKSISQDVEKIVVCPFNTLHSIPEQSLVKHLEECQWKAEGYGKKDLPLSCSSLLAETSLSIKFDEQLQDKVIQCAKQQNPTLIIGAGGRLIPRTSDRLIAEFTRDERLAMYEYVIANTAQPDIGEDITDMNKPKASDGKTSSYLELLAQERNLKRRRAKYRGVHTNKKSQVEILREVINQQMEMLAEYISEKNDDAINEGADFPRDRDISKDGISHNSYYTTKSDRFVTEKSESRSGDGHDKQHQVRTSTTSADLGFRKGSLNDRGYDRGNNGFRDSYERNEFPKEKSRYSSEQSQREQSRRVSSDRISHTSSHKSYKHRSKDRHEERHKRHRSREREKSRCSRDSKYDERRAEDSRHSKHNDRRSKKRRRSRDC